MGSATLLKFKVATNQSDSSDEEEKKKEPKKKWSNLDEDGFEVAGPIKGNLKVNNSKMQMERKQIKFSQDMKKKNTSRFRVESSDSD